MNLGKHDENLIYEEESGAQGSPHLVTDRRLKVFSLQFEL